jgi:hypothetical protein
VAAPNPFLGEGGSGPLEADRSGQAQGGLAPTRGGPRPPWESGSVGATREHSCPHGHVEAPDL